MKRIFSTILIFLISLPACGMVFSGELNTMGHHSHKEIGSIHADHIDEHTTSTIDDGGYDCCTNTQKASLEKDSITPSSIKYISLVTVANSLYFQDFIGVVFQQFNVGAYRMDAPPDPSEYISLVGSSVKNLN